MSLNETVLVVFGALTAVGGGAGLYKVFTARSSNRLTDSKTKRNDVETFTFLLDSLRKVQKTANDAQSLAYKAQEEVAFLRRWIIEQGLVPPEFIGKLEEDENVYQHRNDAP
jgi:hypothetical protein